MEQLDALLEELTAKLVELTDEGSQLEAVILEAGDYYLQFAGSEDDIIIEVVGNENLPEDRPLSDYQLALILNMQFEFEEEDDEGGNLFLEYELDGEETWEEETLREFGLLAIGIMHHVFQQPPSETSVRVL